jgi:dienelactone hydrolase
MVFEYFKGNYPWNMAALTLVEEVGVISQPAEAFAAVAELANAPLDVANRAWYEAMSALGEKQEVCAEADLAAGHPLTAARKFDRSARYFIRAERIVSHDDPAKLIAYKRALKNYRKARDYGQDGVEFVEIPFEGGFMPALLIPATTKGKPAPIVVQIQGFDSLKESLFPIFQEYRRRGLSCLMVDQPGAGGALRLYGLTARVETEGYVSKIIDWIKARPDLATDRIGLVGQSMGGYFAPRAAAFEPRVRACAAFGALYDAGRLMSARAEGEQPRNPSVPDTFKHGMWTFGVDTPTAFISVMKKLTLKGVVDKITCPLLVLHGENDRQVPVEDAVDTYETATTSDKTLKIFRKDEGGVEHCQFDDRALAADCLADWFAKKL